MKVSFFATVLVLFLFAAAPSVTQAVDIYDLKINEICPVHVQGIVETESGAWIELYNPLASNISTVGLHVVDADLRPIADLPMIVLPPESYLLIKFGLGNSDYDATDGLATYCIGRTEDLRMPVKNGGLALFRGTVGVADNIRDFVAWGTGPLDGSPAQTLAITRGIWTEGAFVDLTSAADGSTFGLSLPGLDRDADSPWAIFSGQYYGGIQTPGGPNILMAHPLPGEVVLDGLNGMVPADWVATSFPGGATSYQIALDYSDEFGGRTNLVNEQTTDTETQLPAGQSGEYIWRIDPCEDGLPLGPSREIRFFRARPLGERVDLGVPFLSNRKDTGMLCTYNLGASTRPGCDDASWNVSHAVPLEHDAWYSARAAVAMVNRYYGGNLSQDRISYEVFRTRFPGAEGDLGHGVGFRTIEMTNTLRWSLGGITTQYAPYAPPFDYLKAEIDLGHPVVITTTPGGTNREGIVIGGYVIFSLYDQGPPMPAVKVLDPRAGAEYWVLYSFFAPSIAAHWQITGNPVGIVQEATIAQDTDADGIVDFDEDPTRQRLGSSATSSDSDGDLIADLLEVYCYTFHDWMHPDHSNDAAGFSDVDGDALRSEADYDSDGGGVPDGLEDLDRDGIAPETGETCPYLAGDGGEPPSAGVVEGRSTGLRLARLSRPEPGCRFRVDLPADDTIDLVVIAANGRICARLAAGPVSAGSHEILWDGMDVGGNPMPSGVYLLRLATARQGGRVAKFSHLR